jgi:hypothetical protein
MSHSNFEIEAKIYWLFIKDQNPHPIGLAPIESYKGHLPPIIESNFSFMPKIWSISLKEPIDSTYVAYFSDFTQIIMDYYRSLLKSNTFISGKYGDWIKCSIWSNPTETILHIDQIGKAAWQKATLASDLGIFVKGGDIIYFIGIIRKNPPGRGLPAIIGGIRNTDTQFESGIYTAIKEVGEEANLKIIIPNGLETIKEEYNITSLPVIVKGFDQIQGPASISTEIIYVCTVKTPESERLPDGTKRVYATDAFTIFLDLGEQLITEDQIREVLHAGDDAANLVIFDVSEFFGKNYRVKIFEPPIFGLEHHGGLFLAMVEKIIETRKLK